MGKVNAERVAGSCIVWLGVARVSTLDAKTLYNLTHPAAPFDADSPYWVLPNAFTVASHYAIPESDIVATFKA